MTLEDAKQSITLYVENRIQPGSFLIAVLENNLRNAIACADETSLLNLKPIVQFVHHDIPGCCWGGREAVLNHLHGGTPDLNGTVGNC